MLLGADPPVGLTLDLAVRASATPLSVGATAEGP